MKITARIRNGQAGHHVVVSTGDAERTRVSEIQNTVRRGLPVTLVRTEAEQTE